MSDPFPPDVLHADMRMTYPCFDEDATTVDALLAQNKFQLFLNVIHFWPKEIEVKISDGCIVVHAKQEERLDGHGLISREFKGKYDLPVNVKPGTIKCVYNKNGVLEIGAPKQEGSCFSGKYIDETIEVEIQESSEEENYKEIRGFGVPCNFENSPIGRYFSENPSFSHLESPAGGGWERFPTYESVYPKPFFGSSSPSK